MAQPWSYIQDVLNPPSTSFSHIVNNGISNEIEKTELTYNLMEFIKLE